MQEMTAANQTRTDESLADLIASHHSTVMRVLTSVVKNSSEAEDLAQDVWLRVATHRGQLRDPERFRPWITQIARREALDFVRQARHKWRTVDIDEPGVDLRADRSSDPEYRMDLEHSRQRVLQTLSLLSERDRRAIVLRDINGFSYREIGQVLGVSPGTAYTIICRGRSRFRQRFVGDEARSEAHSVSVEKFDRSPSYHPTSTSTASA